MFVKIYVFITNLSASESLLCLTMDDEQETYKMWKVASCEKVFWNESINLQVRKTVMQLCHDRGYLVTQVASIYSYILIQFSLSRMNWTRLWSSSRSSLVTNPVRDGLPGN